MPFARLLLICYTTLGVALVAGCQSFGHTRGVALPLATHQFTIEPTDDVVGTVQVVTAREEDTLSDIARRFNLGYEEIVNANPGVDPWLPRVGTRVVLPTAFVLPDVQRRGIVINLAAMRLFYFPEKVGERQVVITHPLGIGRVGWRTPEGKTRIVSKAVAPSWIPTPAIHKEYAANGVLLPKVVPPGPHNPMGTHALRLGWPAYTIHGTDKPPSIGLRGTHGCLRMYPEDIVGLYEAVPVGTPVTVINQPFLVGWRGDMLVMQAYPVLEDDWRNHHQGIEQLIGRVRDSVRGRGVPEKLVVNRALTEEIVQTPRGIAVPITEAATLQEYLAQVHRVKNVLPLNATWWRKVTQRSADAVQRLAN